MWDNHPFLAYFGLWLLLIAGGGMGAAWAIKHLPAQPAPAVASAAKIESAAKPSAKAAKQAASGKHASEASASRRAAQAKKVATEKRRHR